MMLYNVQFLDPDTGLVGCLCCSEETFLPTLAGLHESGMIISLVFSLESKLAPVSWKNLREHCEKLPLFIRKTIQAQKEEHSKTSSFN
jgi:hypothetical protein